MLTQPMHLDLSADERRAKAAIVLGLAPDAVGVAQLELNHMRQFGVLVDVDVCGATMFQTRTTFAELGLSDQAKRRKRFRPGIKTLGPEDINAKLLSLDRRYRTALENHSFDVEFFRPFRWVPYTAWSKWQTEAKQISADLEAFKAEIIANLPIWREEVRAEWSDYAGEAWAGLVADKRPLPGETIAVDNHQFRDEAEFAEYVITSVLGKFPTPEKVQTQLRMEWRVSVLATAADLEQDMLAREKLRAERLAIQNQIDIDRQTAEARIDANRQLAFEGVRAAALENKSKEASLQAMQQAALEQFRKQMAETASPVNQLVEQLVNSLAEKASQVAESLANNNGQLRGKTAALASGLLEYYELMSAGLKYDALRDRLAELQAAVGQVGHRSAKRDSAEVAAALANLQAELDLATANLRRGSRFSLIASSTP